MCFLCSFVWVQVLPDNELVKPEGGWKAPEAVDMLILCHSAFLAYSYEKSIMDSCVSPSIPESHRRLSDQQLKHGENWFLTKTQAHSKSITG